MTGRWKRWPQLLILRFERTVDSTQRTLRPPLERWRRRLLNGLRRRRASYGRRFIPQYTEAAPCKRRNGMIPRNQLGDGEVISLTRLSYPAAASRFVGPAICV